MSIITDIIRLIRPTQWVKNLFVLLPVIFGGRLPDISVWTHAGEAFIAFCLLASGVYIFNDVIDAEADRSHPVKRLRPIASGKIKPSRAMLLSAFFIFLSFACSIYIFHFAPALTGILFAYLVINFLYTVWLKYIAIVDVITIAVGFVLRVLLGGLATDIYVSAWLIMMVFLLCLLIAFGKRRAEVIRMEQGGTARKSVDGYNRGFMDRIMSLLAATVIVAYICYTLTPAVEERFNSPYVFLTSIFVIAGILRYLQIVFVRTESENPTDIMLHDRFIIICILLWLATFIMIIYYPHT